MTGALDKDTSVVLLRTPAVKILLDGAKNWLEATGSWRRFSGLLFALLVNVLV